MPASKRRRAAASRRTGATATPEVTPVVTTADAAPTPALPSRQPRRQLGATAAVRATASSDPDQEPRWSPLGLLVLLTIAFAVQLPVGVLIHATSHTNLLIIDMFFFQPQYILLACFLAMPIARILTHQPRPLRLLESLSLGAVYALLAVLLATTFVHPNNGSQTSAQFVSHLNVSDGLRIAFADVLALIGTVAAFPGINRLLGAPGRRARARMVRRGAPGQPRGRGDRPAPGAPRKSR